MSNYTDIGNDLTCQIREVEAELAQARAVADESEEYRLQSILDGLDGELHSHMFGDVESTCHDCGQDNTMGECLCDYTTM